MLFFCWRLKVNIVLKIFFLNIVYMKKLNSIILLFAFLVGAMQPVVPLLEYHIFQESIMELFCENRNVPESDCDGICYLTNQIEKQQERQDENFKTLVDYYPGTILVKAFITPGIFSSPSEYAPDLKYGITSAWIDIQLPPPRVS